MSIHDWSHAAAVGPPAPSDAAATAAVIALGSVCLPLLQGANLATTVKSQGFKKLNGQWVLTFGDGQQIALEPPDSTNPGDCTATITSASSSASAVRQAVGAWAEAQKPPLALVHLAAPVAGPSHQWLSSVWGGRTASGMESVALGQQQSGQAMSQSNLDVSLTSGSATQASSNAAPGTQNASTG